MEPVLLSVDQVLGLVALVRRAKARDPLRALEDLLLDMRHRAACK